MRACNKLLVAARSTSLVACCFAILQGCAVGPDYREPDVAAPAEWHALQTATSAATANAADLEWWESFDDPLLTSLIERALRNNLDLDQAIARVREARARRGIVTADLLPRVSGSARGTRSEGGSRSNLIDDSDTRTLYDAGFDAAWEIDLFGGLRRSREAATAQLEASQADLNDVLITLLGEVALNYTDYRTAQARIEFAKRNLQSQSEAYDITRWRAEAGLSSALDVEQAQTSLEQTRAQIPALEANLNAFANRLAVLLGEAPGALAAELEPVQRIPVAPATLVTDLPANVLRQRPDVRRAERQLAAQSAQIGVATAALYPSLTLSGSIGVQASALSDLSSADAIKSAGIGLNVPIFNGGALRQNVKVQNAVFDQVFASYRSTVLLALEESDNAFVAWLTERRRYESLSAAVASARRATELALLQYNSGLVDFEAVLTAQRAQTSLEDSLALSEGELTSNTIRVYKALGGGANRLPALLTSAR
jgi:NodT family efflux transporter outer membrane factor (OMF) lipoprotein